MAYGEAHLHTPKTAAITGSSASEFSEQRSADRDYLPRLLSVFLEAGLLSSGSNSGNGPSLGMQHLFPAPYKGD